MSFSTSAELDIAYAETLIYATLDGKSLPTIDRLLAS